MADREKMIDLRREGEKIAENFCVSKQECYQCPYNAPNGCKEGLIADHLIANAVTIQKWIPLSEQKPDRDTLVIVFFEGMRDTPAAIQIMYGWCIGGSATHWMPLPEPPKGE